MSGGFPPHESFDVAKRQFRIREGELVQGIAERPLQRVSFSIHIDLNATLSEQVNIAVERSHSDPQLFKKCASKDALSVEMLEKTIEPPRTR